MLSCKVTHKGVLISEHTFEQDIVKVGLLGSSHLRLEGVARMHAVLEKTSDGWRVIDLGSDLGTKLNGEAVRTSAPMGDEGTLEFGPYQVAFVSRPSLVPKPDAWQPPASPLVNARHHHALMSALVKELRATAPQEISELAEKALRMWPSLSSEIKRRILRTTIHTLRRMRKGRSLVDSFVRDTLQDREILGIFSLSPEDALTRARAALDDLARVGAALNVLNMYSEGDNDESQAKGADLLRNLVAKEGAEAMTTLTLCLARAGGFEGDPQPLLEAFNAPTSE